MMRPDVKTAVDVLEVFLLYQERPIFMKDLFKKTKYASTTFVHILNLFVKKGIIKKEESVTKKSRYQYTLLDVQEAQQLVTLCRKYML